MNLYPHHPFTFDIPLILPVAAGDLNLQSLTCQSRMLPLRHNADLVLWKTQESFEPLSLICPGESKVSWSAVAQLLTHVWGEGVRALLRKKNNSNCYQKLQFKLTSGK